jgi:thioredoxin 1
MPIREVTDADLRNIIFENPRVIVKFTKTNCPVCERMHLRFLKLSQDKRYQNITFLRMDAAENPVSSQEVHLTGTPFFAAYRDSVLTECKLISDEEELEALLNTLL